MRTQPNFWVHVFAACLALVLGVVLRLSPVELAIIVLCIALVMVVEAVNSGIETMCDLISPGHHPLIKRAKDISGRGRAHFGRRRGGCGRLALRTATGEPAALASHPCHFQTAVPQLRPAPNPLSTTVDPTCTRSSSMASHNATGTLAADVFP